MRVLASARSESQARPVVACCSSIAQEIDSQVHWLLVLLVGVPSRFLIYYKNLGKNMGPGQVLVFFSRLLPSSKTTKCFFLEPPEKKTKNL